MLYGLVNLLVHPTFQAGLKRCTLGLSRTVLVGAVGLYLALTGKRLSKPADLLRIGLATHFVTVERLPQLTQALGLRTLKRSSTKASALSGLEPMLQQFAVRRSHPVIATVLIKMAPHVSPAGCPWRA